MKRRLLTKLSESAEKLVVFDKLINATARDYYYGVELPDVYNGEGKVSRGLLCSTNYDDGYSAHEFDKIPISYFVRTLDGLTYGNGWNDGNRTASTLLELIKQLIADGSKVYQFTTPNELITWLLDPKNAHNGSKL